jgi:hypothetical protein
MSKWISYINFDNFHCIHFNDEIKNYFKNNLLKSHNFIQITDDDWNKIRQGGGVYKIENNSFIWEVNKDDQSVVPGKTPPRDLLDPVAKEKALKTFIPKQSIINEINFMISQCTRIENIVDFPQKDIWAELKIKLVSININSLEDEIEASSWIMALEKKSIFLPRGPFELNF